MFCDFVLIDVKAGNGGNGRLSFLHQKYREYGGPDGGDGGKGGDIIFRTADSCNTLYYFKTHHKITAENGQDGKARKSHGRNGHDTILIVPPGTIVYEQESGRVIADLVRAGEEAIIAQGGEGGFGNAHFTSSTRQTPQFAELGLSGETFALRLELKLIADVGLLGLPNIGKSTFLSVVSQANPKIADYPFTTITPNLGVVEGWGTKGFIIADIPGIIKGAARGKGLGEEFLKHIERTRLLLHFVDGTSPNIEQDIKTIVDEIKRYQKKILEKPQILVISKGDLLVSEAEKKTVSQKAEKIVKTSAHFATMPYMISGVTHQGIKNLLFEVERILKTIPKKAYQKIALPVITIEDLPRNIFSVKKICGKYQVTGNKIDRFAAKTDFTNPHGVARLIDVMEKMGIIKEIEKLGGETPYIITINGNDITY